mgnify:CR=1 FL=1
MSDIKFEIKEIVGVIGDSAKVWKKRVESY